MKTIEDAEKFLKNAEATLSSFTANPETFSF